MRDIPDLSPSSTAIIYHLTSHLIQACSKMATVFPLGEFYYWSGDRGEDVWEYFESNRVQNTTDVQGASLHYIEAPEFYEYKHIGTHTFTK